MPIEARTDTVGVLIVGAGHGGTQTAIALRREGFDGSILLLGEESDLPYERPSLSKDYLVGSKPFEEMQIRPRTFYDAQRIELCLGIRVESVDAGLSHARLSDGSTVSYDAMVWAAGGRPRRLTCSGHDLPRVHTIRSRADVDQFRSALPAVRNVVVVGGGYLGLEAAAALRKLGKSVTIVEMQDRVLARVAGEPVSRFYEAEHRRHGVAFRLGEGVECIEEEGSCSAAVRLGSGERLPADAVVVGIGIVPETAVLAAAGAACGDGVEVDEWCQTSLPDIFAVGDVARHRNRYCSSKWVRIESVQNATDQAATVARSITGKRAAYDALPWFWSIQYDLRLQTVGLAHGYDDLIVRGDMSARSFSVIYLREGKVIALDCVNATRDYVQGRALVASGAEPSRALLLDPAVSLKSLAP